MSRVLPVQDRDEALTAIRSSENFVPVGQDILEDVLEALEDSNDRYLLLHDPEKLFPFSVRKPNLDDGFSYFPKSEILDDLRKALKLYLHDKAVLLSGELSQRFANALFELNFDYMCIHHPQTNNYKEHDEYRRLGDKEQVFF